MLRPRAQITFTKADDSTTSFTFFKGWETNESYESVTDTLAITVARKFQTMQGVDLFSGPNPVFSRGDKVVITAGYYPNTTIMFSGYIRSVNTNIPIEIQCEDGMFLLKQYRFNIPSKINLITRSKRGKFLKRPKVDTSSIPNLSLKQLLDLIIPDDVQYNLLDDIQLGKLRAVNATPAQILAKIKETHGIFSYFVGEILYVGFANNALSTKNFTFQMEQTVINSNQLFYKRAEEISIQVKATSMNDQNVKTEQIVGDLDGETRSYHYYNLTAAQLLTIAQKKLAEIQYTGFFGVMETFLEPYVRHGDSVTLVSTKLPERNGTYLVKSVRRVMDVQIGGRQFLELGAKIA